MPGKVITAFLTAVLCAVPVCSVAAPPAAPGGMEYDIPISELNKTQKESPRKRVVSESKKKKKGDARSRATVPAAGAAAVTEPRVPAATAQQAPVASEPLPEGIRIRHLPYSFVVSGRRTVIQAVINGEADVVQAVNCKIRVVEGGAQAIVKMAKVSGTQFTYETTLPGLAPGIASLRYTIVAVDSSGKEISSQEFSTPVTSSSVLPGWQIENTGGAIQLELKNPKKPGL